MTATFISDLVTEVTLDELLAALQAGYLQVLGTGQDGTEVSDSAPCLACLGSQLSLESGRGKKAHRFNWGNEKLPKNWDGLYTQFTCDEIFDAQTAARAKQLGPCELMVWKGGPLVRVVLHPPHPWSSFVAFNSAEQGAADYVELLSLNTRYRAAWHAAYVGDAAGFSHALHASGYYTADEDAYTKGVVSLTKELLPICQRILAPDSSGITDSERASVSSLVAQTVATFSPDSGGPPTLVVA